MPSPTSEVSNRLDDLERDLANVARGDNLAPQEFADDLVVFAGPGSEPAARELARRVVTVVGGSKLDEPTSERLANQLWVAVAARELSERQVETLQDEVKGTLVSLGATEQNAQGVSDQVGDVQKAVSSRRRRWYEFF